MHEVNQLLHLGSAEHKTSIKYRPDFWSEGKGAFLLHRVLHLTS